MKCKTQQIRTHCQSLCKGAVGGDSVCYEYFANITVSLIFRESDFDVQVKSKKSQKPKDPLRRFLALL